jgi:hypothetical protein
MPGYRRPGLDLVLCRVCVLIYFFPSCFSARIFRFSWFVSADRDSGRVLRYAWLGNFDFPIGGFVTTLKQVFFFFFQGDHTWYGVRKFILGVVNCSLNKAIIDQINSYSTLKAQFSCLSFSSGRLRCHQWFPSVFVPVEYELYVLLCTRTPTTWIGFDFTVGFQVCFLSPPLFIFFKANSFVIANTNLKHFMCIIYISRFLKIFERFTFVLCHL